MNNVFGMREFSLASVAHPVGHGEHIFMLGVAGREESEAPHAPFVNYIEFPSPCA